MNIYQHAQNQAFSSILDNISGIRLCLLPSYSVKSIYFTFTPHLKTSRNARFYNFKMFISGEQRAFEMK